MTIAQRYGELFQMSYITRDLDAAMAHCRAELGIAHFDTSNRRSKCCASASYAR